MGDGLLRGHVDDLTLPGVLALEQRDQPADRGVQSAREAGQAAGQNFRNVAGWLVKHGYSDSEIQAVLGGNIPRLLNEVWR